VKGRRRKPPPQKGEEGGGKVMKKPNVEKYLRILEEDPEVVMAGAAIALFLAAMERAMARNHQKGNKRTCEKKKKKKRG